MRSERLRTPLGIDDCDLRTIEHPLYGRVWAPQRIVHLSALLALFGWALRGGGWRGQGDIDWHLDSTAVRRIGRESATCLEQRVREYELALLEQARLAGHGRVNGRDLHDLELLALLRHHGAATRLMDFTRNVWVALWFACRDVHRGFGLLVGLDLAGSFEVRDQATLAMPFPQLVHKAADRLSTWRPSALSPRMPAQHGFFLWGPARLHRWGSIGEDLVGIREQSAEVEVEPPTSRAVPGFACVAIPPELKHELGLHWRSLFGYTEQTMFPDLDGFAQANAASAPLAFVPDDDAAESGEESGSSVASQP
jgi:hypothetical protein